jgi:hypothetical protein
MKILYIINDLLFPIILALLGGALHLLQRPTENELSLREYAAGIIAAAFVGAVIWSLMSGLIPDGPLAAMVGIAGYASNDALRIMKAWFLRELKKRLRGDNQND